MTNTFIPKTNSMSPEKEQLAEIQEHALDYMWHARADKRTDPGIWWRPVPYDPRFPNTDVSKWCMSSFVDYYRCRKLRGPDYEPCSYFENAFKNVCPDYIIDRLESERAKGSFLAGV